MKDVNQGRFCQSLFHAIFKNLKRIACLLLHRAVEHTWGGGSAAEVQGGFWVFLGSCSLATTAMTLHILNVKEVFGRAKMLTTVS